MLAASVVPAGAAKVFTALDVKLDGLASVATMAPGFAPPPARIVTTVSLPDTSRNGMSTAERV